VSGTELVGREAELDAVGRLIEAAARGESAVLLVRGEAGIGKTRLLDALSDRAADRRFAVLRGRATELESDVPFAAVAEAFEPLDDVALSTPASPAERWRLHRALRDRLDTLPGGRPFALVLDDVHLVEAITRPEVRRRGFWPRDDGLDLLRVPILQLTGRRGLVSPILLNAVTGPPAGALAEGVGARVVVLHGLVPDRREPRAPRLLITALCHEVERLHEP
jgi:hypothetical protein